MSHPQPSGANWRSTINDVIIGRTPCLWPHASQDGALAHVRLLELGSHTTAPRAPASSSLPVQGAPSLSCSDQALVRAQSPGAWAFLSLSGGGLDAQFPESGTGTVSFSLPVAGQVRP